MYQVKGTELSVFELALGANTFGWTSDKDDSFAVIDAYREAGGNFIDTADVYSAWGEGLKGGESETVIGEWLRERKARDQVVIATKVSQHPDFPGLSPENIQAACEASSNGYRPTTSTCITRISMTIRPLSPRWRGRSMR